MMFHKAYHFIPNIYISFISTISSPHSIKIIFFKKIKIFRRDVSSFFSDHNETNASVDIKKKSCNSF